MSATWYLLLWKQDEMWMTDSRRLPQATIVPQALRHRSHASKQNELCFKQKEIFLNTECQSVNPNPRIRSSLQKIE